ncbi:uncharacterized protein LOC110669013 [Hevea brasiliensis]|uniref:uncharacterized protein LOC110669013 n=1 Tax=Hevea brasiliensis TaxID=3981 RepID=UPI0025D9DD83|nr:uncharacterized protein LOC110669013 [Hevea brasiliensis]
MRPTSLHSNFFSSLKQVEKRLKLESPTQPFNLPHVGTNDTSTESLSTPIYLHIEEEPNSNNSTTLQESSEPPPAFLSSSMHSSSTNQNPHQEIPQEQPKTINGSKTTSVDDIELLMQLLGLSDFDKGNHEKESFCDDSCRCEGGFYEKIVGAKGPKCKKEVERLEGWIRYYLQDGGGEEKREPLRLAFLLLGKANFESENGDGASFGGLDIEFPSAIEEFLKYDPPRESN